MNFSVGKRNTVGDMDAVQVFEPNGDATKVDACETLELRNRLQLANDPPIGARSHQHNIVKCRVLLLNDFFPIEELPLTVSRIGFWLLFWRLPQFVSR